MSKNKKEIKRIKKELAIQRGIDRKHFFENGGELSQWRGVKVVYKNKKKEKNRKKCRGKYHG